MKRRLSRVPAGGVKNKKAKTGTTLTILTSLVLRQSKQLAKQEKKLFSVWCAEKRTEFLPEGIPYKVTSNPIIRSIAGWFPTKINRPVILVSDKLTRTESRNVARHEYLEWQTARASDINPHYSKEAHLRAVRYENPRIREGIIKNIISRRGRRG